MTLPMENDDPTTPEELAAAEDARRSDEHYGPDGPTVTPTPDDYEPLEAEDTWKSCALCDCTAVVRLFGFRVCEYHRTHSEDDPACPTCAIPRVVADDDAAAFLLAHGADADDVQAAIDRPERLLERAQAHARDMGAQLAYVEGRYRFDRAVWSGDLARAERRIHELEAELAQREADVLDVLARTDGTTTIAALAEYRERVAGRLEAERHDVPPTRVKLLRDVRLHPSLPDRHPMAGETRDDYDLRGI